MRRMLYKKVDPNRLVEFLKQKPATIKLGPKAKDLTDLRFGWLVALMPIGRDRLGSIVWRCRCGCGCLSDVRGQSLTHGMTKSCGCLRSMRYRSTFNICDSALFGEEFGGAVGDNLARSVSLDDLHAAVDNLD